MTRPHSHANATAHLEAAELAHLIERRSDVTLLDVRSAGEFASEKIPGSVNVPLDVLKENPAVVASRLQGEVTVLCQSGVRSVEAAGILAAAGYGDVRMLEGGINAWKGAGLEVETGKGHWAMDRQVRFVAGGLVLVSVLLSVAFPPLKWLAAAVGFGLARSAVVNSCAMGRLLGRLPYNQGSPYSLDAALPVPPQSMAA